jgi:glycosyltransferase involved in cell wall biosynthesis
MRIVMLAQNYVPIVGGEERLVEDLSIELACRGHHVSVATIRGQDHEWTDVRDGVRVHALRSSVYRARRLYGGAERPQAPPVPDPETMLDLRRVLRREQPDVVHAHNWLVHSYLPLHRRSGAALVVSLHDYSLLCATKRLLYEGTPCSGPGPRKCLRCATKHYRGVNGAPIALGILKRGPALRRAADRFLPVSRAVADGCGLGSDARSTVIPNFVRDRPARSSDDARLEQLPKEPFVLFLGDLTLDKGVGCLAQAYQMLAGAPPLVLIGRRYLPQLPEESNILALGPWPHALAQEALHRCLFGVVPTIMPEAFGLVALECAAAGKAVVASDVGGLREVVVHDETGLLCAPGDRSELRTALQRLIDDAPLRERLADGARRRAETFTSEAIVPLFELAYQTALQARQGAS